jgi:TldD protein
MQEYEGIADYAISYGLRQGFDYVEAYLESGESFSYSRKQGNPNSSYKSKYSGIRLRLIKNGSLYTYSTNIISKERIKEAFKFSGFKGEKVELSEEKAEKYSYKVKERIKVEDSYESAAKDVEELDKSLNGLAYKSISINLGKYENLFVNSEGSRLYSEIPYISSFILIIVKNANDSRQKLIQLGNTGGYEVFKWEKVRENIDEEINSLKKILKEGISLSKSQINGIKNIVASSEIMGIAVHESIGHPLEADRVFGREAAQAGTSYLTPNNLGLKIGSKEVNILDDPTIKNSYGFFLYDEEGVKARKKHLVKNGIQNELLLNREYAKALGTRSNASSRSDFYSNEPIIRMSNTYLEKGKADFEELISEAKNGIYIKSFAEWNIDDTRSFARYQGNEAYIIKNGNIEKPVKNYKLEKSTFDFWSSVYLLGNDFNLYAGTCGKGEPLQGVPVMYGGPSALLKFGDK